MNTFKDDLRNFLLSGKSIGALYGYYLFGKGFNRNAASCTLVTIHKRFYPGGERGHASRILDLARKTGKGIPKKMEGVQSTLKASTVEQKPPLKYLKKHEMTLGSPKPTLLQSDAASLRENPKGTEMPNVSPQEALEILKKSMRDDPKAIVAIKDRLSQKTRGSLHTTFTEISNVNTCSEGPGHVGLPPVPLEPLEPLLEMPYVPEIDATLIAKPGGIFDIKYTVPPLPTTIPSSTPLVVPQPSKVNDNSLKELEPPTEGNTHGNDQTPPSPPAGEIKRLFDALEERSLLKRVYGEEKLTSKFYELLAQTKNKLQTKIFYPENLSNTNTNLLFEIGLLEVKNKHNTLLLSGVQSHVIIIVIFDVKSDQRILWAYFTSEQNSSHIKLSEKQPFNFEKNINKKPQMLHVLKKPFVVTNTAIEKLPILKIDNIVINQQDTGMAYIKDPFIHNKLENALNSKTLPILKKQNEMLDTYAGNGITKEDITNVLIQADLSMKEHVDKFFNLYIKEKNKLDKAKLERWLIQQEKTLDKKTFEALKERIKDEENKHR
jgi:hypothetical protein